MYEQLRCKISTQSSFWHFTSRGVRFYSWTVWNTTTLCDRSEEAIFDRVIVQWVNKIRKIKESYIESAVDEQTCSLVITCNRAINSLMAYRMLPFWDRINRHFMTKDEVQIDKLTNRSCGSPMSFFRATCVVSI